MESINKIKEEVKKRYSNSKDPCHDIYHTLRVYKSALILQKKEGGDIQIIAASALLHDLHQIESEKKKKYVPPRDTLRAAEKILLKNNFPKEKIKNVLYCIKYHDRYESSKTKEKIHIPRELAILHDADNLDGMGAIGIGRTFAFGGVYGKPMWNGEKIKKQKDDITKANENTIQHFYDNLLRIKERLHTKTAKKLANERHKFMLKFLKQFFKEWKGK